MAAYREPMIMREKSPVSAQEPHSQWHSPVPYLFCGLAAMLGLIAFALLIRVACSFWKLSGYLEGNEEAGRDLEAGEAKIDETQKAPPQPYKEKILVIMAGQERPTFLATPMWSSRSSSFGNNISSSTCTCNKTDKSVEMAETVKLVKSRDRDRETPDTSSEQNH